jgi:hypothetical protein
MPPSELFVANAEKVANLKKVKRLCVFVKNPSIHFAFFYLNF